MADRTVITTHVSTVDEWTRALAESIGSPGGGAGAGVMLAIGASLTSMVAGYTDASDDPQLKGVLSRARERRSVALQLADDDASASAAFGAAFRLDKGAERDKAIAEASVEAAQASAALGEYAIDAVDDLVWLAEHGNPALIADVVVAFGALRAAITGARTNVSFDLASVTSSGVSFEEVREQHPQLWDTITRLNDAIDRIDSVTTAVDHRAAPTDVA
ncbi:Formiminotetrahydrofolate cyclodeaminase [Paramicrobacterium humi]|uniref:Formiminotetrahydrofolate cyclodeaminase n=1 Tax=Paramicrobacterium humi TaxID=640635 RepID=A0A1H4IQJ7_9MICO|nr:cyclodeaminase/cyclohydrolase family protein [Microbacterium humi]SEB36329.1 Formiminotetrahydrofolate cyclodeaminase [Microbacterium humi]